jgi:hypothetical protein
MDGAIVSLGLRCCLAKRVVCLVFESYFALSIVFPTVTAVPKLNNFVIKE